MATKTTYKVGDKVRILDVKNIIGGETHWDNGDIVKVTKAEGRIWLERKKTKPSPQKPFLHDYELQYIELVSPKPTKNQRLTSAEQAISTLEQKVEAMQAEIDALKAAQSVGKTAEAIAKAIEKHSPKLTPNEQRKAIIAEAKAFVEKYSEIVKVGTTPYTAKAGDTTVKLFVNKEKRIVTAIPHLVHVNHTEHEDKKFAKCNPSDVFNADIGKAIALGRALGLDVSKFEKAVQPSEYTVGQIVTFPVKDSWHRVYSYRVDSTTKSSRNLTKLFEVNGKANADLSDNDIPKLPIIDDTEAQY